MEIPIYEVVTDSECGKCSFCGMPQTQESDLRRCSFCLKISCKTYRSQLLCCFKENE